MDSTRAPSLTVDATTVLSNGVHMPLFGYGTSHNGGFSSDALEFALQHGYRMVDTARRYGCERQIGQVLLKHRCRERVWLTSKLWPGDYGRVEAACVESLRDLGVAHLDLFLMHWPEVPATCSGGNEAESRLLVWRAMESLYEKGLCRAIGVSNFLPHHLDGLLDGCSIRPHVNQVEFNPFQQPVRLLEHCRREGIHLQGYCPLAKAHVLDTPVVASIAERHGKTAAQCLIRYSLQKGVGAIPKSTKKSRVKENAHVFDFELTSAEMGALDALDCNLRVTWDPTYIP